MDWFYAFKTTMDSTWQASDLRAVYCPDTFGAFDLEGTVSYAYRKNN